MRTFDFKKRFDKATRTFSYEAFEIYRYNIDRNIFVKKNVKVNFWYIYYIFDPKDKWRVTQRGCSWARDVRLTGKIIGSSKKKNISKTKYKYACLLEASKIWDLRQYIEVYEMFPEIEIILKMGMREYFKDLMRYMEIRDVENDRTSDTARSHQSEWRDETDKTGNHSPIAGCTLQAQHLRENDGG